MKFHIRTYGCQMNERDSESVAAVLVRNGLTAAESEADADILIFNTCSVREQAERKAIGKIGLMKKLKAEKPGLLIGVIGCMAENYKEKLIGDMPHIDFVAGTDKLDLIPSIIAEEIVRRRHIAETGIDLAFMGIPDHLDDGSPSAFVSIMRGCSRFCSYCVVPFVRGGERSRSMDSVIEEVEKLAGIGKKEVMLLGQNVAAYGLDGQKPSDESPFAELLQRLSAIEGLRRIRFTSPHPAYFNGKLIDAIASLPKVCRNIHLPMQSGSDRILRMMNRPYSSAQYLQIARSLKIKVPEITFSTDVIVGFPTETEEDFKATRELMELIAFDNAYIFKYSPRKGTAAADLKDDVPTEVKEERNQILLADLAARTERHNKAIVGRTVEVLVEGVSKRNPARWFGRTGTNKVVAFTPSPDIKAGDIINVGIRRATAMTLFGP